MHSFGELGIGGLCRFSFEVAWLKLDVELGRCSLICGLREIFAMN